MWQKPRFTPITKTIITISGNDFSSIYDKNVIWTRLDKWVELMDQLVIVHGGWNKDKDTCLFEQKTKQPPHGSMHWDWVKKCLRLITISHYNNATIGLESEIDNSKATNKSTRSIGVTKKWNNGSWPSWTSFKESLWTDVRVPCHKGIVSEIWMGWVLQQVPWL